MHVLGPVFAQLLFLPLAVVLNACLHVGVRDANQMTLAGLKVHNIVKELFDLVLLGGGATGTHSAFLRDHLPEPNRLSDAVLPNVGLKHDAAGLVDLLLVHFKFFIVLLRCDSLVGLANVDRFTLVAARLL